MRVAMVLFKYGVSIHDPCCYPLGFMYVCSALKERGHQVKVFNCNLYDIDVEKEVLGFDCVVMTGHEEFLPQIRQLAAYCKIHRIKTVLGGALATHAPHYMMGIVDHVWEGEIETCPIDDIPWPDYEEFGIDDYHRVHQHRYMGLLTSRGCPYSCTFCAHTCKFRLRDLGKVEEEIQHYVDTYGVERLILNDNTLNLNRNRYLDICEMLEPFNLKWTAAIRVDHFDDEMAEATVESGGDYFVVGVESFNQDKLDRMNKRIAVDDIHSTLTLLHKYGVQYHGNIIFGLRGDTLDSIVREIEELPKEYNLYPVLAQPFVGTQFEATLSPEERQVLTAAFRDYATTKGMTMYANCV